MSGADRTAPAVGVASVAPICCSGPNENAREQESCQRERELEGEPDEKCRLDDGCDGSIPTRKKALEMLLDGEAEQRHERDLPGNTCGRAATNRPNRLTEERCEQEGHAAGECGRRIGQVPVTRCSEIGGALCRARLDDAVGERMGRERAQRHEREGAEPRDSLSRHASMIGDALRVSVSQQGL